MGAAAGNRDGLNRNLYEEISLLCAACGEEWGGAGVPRGRGETRRRRSAAEGCRRSMDIAVGRPKGAARIGPVRHRFASKARAWPSKVRAFGCRGAAPLDGHRGRSAEECRNDKAGAPPVRRQGAGVGGAAAAVGKRRRERDVELQIQTPRLTVRRYEKWGTNIPGRATVGGRRRTSRSAVARKACARDAVGRAGGSGGTNARVSVFFIHIHPRLRRAGRGGAERRTDQFSVRFV